MIKVVLKEMLFVQYLVLSVLWTIICRVVLFLPFFYVF
jgi:hypothetical protein